MRKILIAAALLAGSAVTASSDDTSAAPVGTLLTPVFSWEGGYVGVYSGWATFGPGQLRLGFTADTI